MGFEVKENQSSRVCWTQPIWKMVLVCQFISVVAFCTGCSSLGLGSAQQVKELQAENERLLTEYRAQRNQREKAEEALRSMESRLAESEKLIARQYTPNANRITQLPWDRVQNPTNSLPRVPGLGEGGAFSQQVDANSGLIWQRRVGQ